MRVPPLYHRAGHFNMGRARQLLFYFQLLLMAGLFFSSLPANADETVTKVAAGSGVIGTGFSLILKSDGSLWGMGYNSEGQLGENDGTNAYWIEPRLIIASGVTDIAAGDSHILFIKSDGSLWAMGYNYQGQLGDGDTNAPYVNQPEQIVPGGVTAIAAGAIHSLFLKSDGSLWGMGGNNAHQLGSGLSTNRPEQIVSDSVVAVAAGSYHSLFLKADGSLWAMGDNTYGQIGDGTYNQALEPKQIVPNGVSSITAGDDQSLFIKSDGSLWGMGVNSSCQLGDTNRVWLTEPFGHIGYTQSINAPRQIVAGDVTGIAAGPGRSFFIKSDGSLWVTGGSSVGALGDGRANTNTGPEQIVAGGVVSAAANQVLSLFVKTDGSLWAMGRDYEYVPEQIIPAVESPLNDICANATPITGISSTITQSTATATTTGDTNVSWCAVRKGVWFTYTPPADGILAIDTEGSSFNPTVSLFTGSCESLLAINCLGNRGTAEVSGGTTYHILVGSVNSDSGDLVLHLNYIAPPANDTCAGAVVVTNPSYTVTQSTTPATSLGDPDPIYKGVWFQYTPPEDGLLTVDTFGTSFDTRLALLAGTCDSLSEIAFNDDTAGTLQSSIIKRVNAGMTYYIEAGAGDYVGGDLTLHLNFTSPTPPPPTNDTCAGATVISNPHYSTTQSTSLATSDGDPSPSCMDGFANGVWFQYTAPSNGQLQVDTTGSDFDTVLALYTGSCGSLTEVACNDESNEGMTSKISLPMVAAGTTYYILAGSYTEAYNGDNGNLNFNLNFTPTPFSEHVSKIAAGDEHSLFVKADGSLWGMGDNSGGQLGDDYAGPQPGQIVRGGVTSVAAGGNHSLFIKSDGSFWALGDNTYGELGDGTQDYVGQPEMIVSNGVTAIAAGNDHSLFIKSDGSLWAMGYNAFGQLGDGTWDDTNKPVQIVVSGVTAIAAGSGHSLFIKSDGSLWAMGNNENGQLGDGTFTADDPYGVSHPEQIVPSGVTAISAGLFHSLFIKSDGSLWAMGGNDSGQLGNGTWDDTNQPVQIVASSVTAIAAGYEHSLFLKSDGSLWGMGWNSSGELGDAVPLSDSTSEPVQIVPGGVVAIAAGDEFSLFVKSDGTLWGMGRNDSGQLGPDFDGSTPNKTQPTQTAVPSTVNNITCEQANNITDSDYTVTESMLELTDHSDDGDGDIESLGVWFKFTAPADGQISIETEGNNFDTQVALYSGVCAALSRIENESTDDGSPTHLLSGVVAGTTYYIRGSTRDGLETDGNLTLRFSFTPTPANYLTPIGGTITFDDLPSGDLAIPTGYRGFIWNNFFAFGPEGYSYPGTNGIIQTNSGFLAGVVTSSNIALNGFGFPADLSRSPAGPFDLVSGYFTAAWNDGLQLQVIGHKANGEVYNNTYTLSAYQPTLLNLNYLNVTNVGFASSGGIPAYYTFGGDHFVVDNLTLAVPGPSLAIGASSTGTSLSITWPASSGFILQQTTNLASPNWVDSDLPVSTDGTTKSILIEQPTGTMFFRLKQE